MESHINQSGGGRRAVILKTSWTSVRGTRGTWVRFNPGWDHTQLPSASEARSSIPERSGFRIDDRLDDLPTPLQWVEVGPVEYLDVAGGRGNPPIPRRTGLEVGLGQRLQSTCLSAHSGVGHILYRIRGGRAVRAYHSTISRTTTLSEHDVHRPFETFITAAIIRPRSLIEDKQPIQAVLALPHLIRFANEVPVTFQIG
eukprot:1932484-Rhodomonas_salina.1